MYVPLCTDARVRAVIATCGMRSVIVYASVFLWQNPVRLRADARFVKDSHVKDLNARWKVVSIVYLTRRFLKRERFGILSIRNYKF